MVGWWHGAPGGLSSESRERAGLEPKERWYETHNSAVDVMLNNGFGAFDLAPAGGITGIADLDDACGLAGALRVHVQRRARVEAVPAEPQDKGPEHLQDT